MHKPSKREHRTNYRRPVSRQGPNPSRELLYGRQPVHECLRAQRRKIHALYVATGVRDTAELDRLCALAADCGAARKSGDSCDLAQCEFGDVGVALSSEFLQLRKQPEGLGRRERVEDFLAELKARLVGIRDE